MAKPGHSWKFFRAGGVDQVVLATAADLANLHALDQKLWVALACPVPHDAALPSKRSFCAGEITGGAQERMVVAAA
jgi:hypothetical protein